MSCRSSHWLPCQSRGYKHAIDALRRICREEGVLSLWSGTQATINRAMIVTAAQMSFYDQAKEAIVALTPLGNTPVTHSLASLVAAMTQSKLKDEGRDEG